MTAIYVAALAPNIHTLQLLSRGVWRTRASTDLTSALGRSTGRGALFNRSLTLKVRNISAACVSTRR